MSVVVRFGASTREVFFQKKFARLNEEMRCA